MAAVPELEEESRGEKQGGRENLVDIAVKFLNNPRVVNSPLDQKREFLQKKGLSEEEIEEAVRLSQQTPPSPPPPPPLPPRTPSHLSPLTTYTPSHSRSWKDYAVVVAVIGGLGYAIYQFFKLYAIPWLNARMEHSERMNEISTQLRELQTSLDTTVSGLSETTAAIQASIREQQQCVRNLSEQVTSLQASLPGSGLATKEIKEDVASLKGLLLNRHQFPTPTTTPHSQHTTAIPSWQRTPQHNDSDNIIMNGEERGSERGRPGEGETERGRPGEGETERGRPGEGETERERPGEGETERESDEKETD